MTREQILEEIRAALVDLFEVDGETVGLRTSLVDDLDLDSIDAVDLIAKMQELVGKRIPQESFKKVRTVGDIVDVVHAHLGGAG